MTGFEETVAILEGTDVNACDRAVWALALGLSVKAGWAGPVSDTEKKEVETYFSHRVAKRSLHTAEHFPDGAKGFITEELPPRLAVDTAHPDDPRASRLHYAYCFADAIVRGTAIESQVYLGSGKEIIFTRTAFTVTDIYKPAAGIAVGGTLTVSYIGGEVIDDGERLRVENWTQPHMQRGRSYLLLLKPAQATPGAYFATEQMTEVRDDRLRLIGIEWLGFDPGTRLADFGARLSAAANLPVCQ